MRIGRYSLVGHLLMDGVIMVGKRNLRGMTGWAYDNRNNLSETVIQQI